MDQATVTKTQVDEARALAEKAKMRLAEMRLADFVKQAWHVVEPHTPLKWNWHHQAICDHIQATFMRTLPDGVYTVPPRCTKSTIISVLAPAWWWIDHPYERFLTASYDGTLSTRDAVRTRRVILSSWYQERWSDRFEMTGDQNVKSRYENTKGGHRIAISVGGALGTGDGGDILIIDDGHSAKKSDSEVDLKEKRQWFTEVWYNRVNDPVLGRRLTVGQRVNQGDIPGVAMSDPELDPVVHLNLPMEYEAKQRCVTPIWEDPRTEEGQTLWPEHFPPAILAQYRKRLGPYGYAGQYQQQPSPREGGKFDIDLIQMLDEPPCKVVTSIRSWDKAATEDGGDYSVGAKVGILEDGRPIILDIVRGQWGSGKREKRIKSTAEQDGRNQEIVIEVEGGSGGLDSFRATRKNLFGWTVKKFRPTGAKPARAKPLAVECDNGDLVMLKRSWTQDLLDEMGLFPGGMHDDQVDAICQGYNQLLQAGSTWDDLYPETPGASMGDGLGILYGDEVDDFEAGWEAA